MASQNAEEAVRDIRRTARRQLSAEVEEKIRIDLEGLRGEDGIAGLCRKKGIAQNPHYRWPKEFLEAGKKLLAVILAVRRPPMKSRRFGLRPVSSDSEPATRRDKTDGLVSDE